MSDSAANNILSIYQRHAEAFASQRSRALFEKSWLDKFITVMGGQGSIVDIGCGNGQPIAGYLFSKAFRLRELMVLRRCWRGPGTLFPHSAGWSRICASWDLTRILMV